MDPSNLDEEGGSILIVRGLVDTKVDVNGLEKKSKRLPNELQVIGPVYRLVLKDKSEMIAQPAPQ